MKYLILFGAFVSLVVGLFWFGDIQVGEREVVDTSFMEEVATTTPEVKEEEVKEDVKIENPFIEAAKPRATDPRAVMAIGHLRTVYNDLKATRPEEYEDEMFGITIYLLTDKEMGEYCDDLNIEYPDEYVTEACYSSDPYVIFLRDSYFDNPEGGNHTPLNYILFHEYGHFFLENEDRYPYVNTAYAEEIASDEFAEWVLGGGKMVNNAADVLFERGILNKMGI